MDPIIWIRMLAYAERPLTREPAPLTRATEPSASDIANLGALHRAVTAAIRTGTQTGRPAGRLVARTIPNGAGFDVGTRARVQPVRRLRVRLRGAGVDCAYDGGSDDGAETANVRISFAGSDVFESASASATRRRFPHIDRLVVYLLAPLLRAA
jgi:hypothetical protein